MAFLVQFILLGLVLLAFTAGPYLATTRLAMARGRPHAGKSGRNAFGLRAEPRFYGLLAIFIAILPAALIALVGLGAYVPQAEKSVTTDVIEARLNQPIGENSLSLEPSLTYQEFLALPAAELGFFGSAPQSQLRNTLQVAEDCVAQAAKVMASNSPLAVQPPCLNEGFALNFFRGLGEARLLAEDRIINRTYLAIILAGIFGLACSALISIPGLRARQIQERVTLGLLAAASLVAIAAMVALVLTLIGNTLGFVRFGQTYNYGGPLRLPDWAQAKYADIDMHAVNRWSQKVEPADYMDFPEAADLLLAGNPQEVTTYGVDEDGAEFVFDQRLMWNVTIDGESVDLALSPDLLRFVGEAKQRGAPLGEKDIRRLLTFAPQLVEATYDKASHEAAVADAKAKLADATSAAQAKYQAFIAKQVAKANGAKGEANLLTPTYLTTYGGLDAQATLAAMTLLAGENEEAFAKRQAARAEIVEDEIKSAQRRYAREQNKRAFLHFQDLSDAQRRGYWWRDLLSWEYKPGAANSADEPSHRFGILGIFYGTLSVGVMALLVAVPLGLLAAIYVSEFASRSLRSVAKPALEILAGIPTIVYGYFALLAVAPLIQNGFVGIETGNTNLWQALATLLVLGGAFAAAVWGARAIFRPGQSQGEVGPWFGVVLTALALVLGLLAVALVAPWIRGLLSGVGGPYLRDLYNLTPLYSPDRRMVLGAGLVMGFMLIPFISSTTEDALAAVPKGMKDGALAMGSTKVESLFRVQFFAALPGIVGGILLAVSRAIGETMIVFVAAGASPIARWTLDPLVSQTTATVIIADRFGGAEDTEGTGVVYLAFTIGFVLLMMTLLLNLVAIFVVRRFRARYE